ncbi:hypothetical protein [Vreelandella sedimenti]|uniref:hypothetical protein n=1 Tax=Vreelandella TaxID=3137766 RepID=UPI00257FAF88|nr:hypothetical protein [Halomonas sp. UBA3173]|tara:strand:- start:43438 stop:43770 length:333 start_codon:yes stop_codon:yes gene_type:complete
MSLDAPKTITEVFTANQLPSAFTCTLLQCQELALAVNLQRQYAVLFETDQHGIFCQTWLAAHNAQHESHTSFNCFYAHTDTAMHALCAINDHLTKLLHESAGPAPAEAAQ